MIRRVSPDGSKIETIAGNATARTAPLGDGKPALEAHIGQVNDMTVAPDGTIYWVERNSPTNGYKGRCASSRRTASSRRSPAWATKVAENGTPASEVALGSDPKGVALGPDGSIYLALGLEKKVVKIAPNGATTRFAGKGVADERGKITPGGKASESYIDSPWSIAASSDGTVYIRSLGNDVSPSASVILQGRRERRRCSSTPGRLLGTCGSGAPDGESATSICMQNHSTTIGVDGDGGLTFADGRYLIRKVAPPLPGFDAEGLALPSSDGLEVYEFDRNGRHLRTRDGLTGAVAQDVRVRRRQAARRRRRRVRQPHADRARRRGHGDRHRRAGRPAHRADPQRRRLPRVRQQPRRPSSTASPTTTPAGCSRASRSPAAPPPASTTTRPAG